MTASATLIQTEAKLFVRDPIGMFFGLVFPTALLLVLGSLYPGFDEPAADLGGDRYIDVYSPIALVLGLSTLGLVTLPPILGTYRQFGILRRLSTTPVHPAKLLTAQLVVHTAVALVAAIAAIVAVMVAFDVVFPKLPFWFLVSFALAVVSIFTIGLLVGAFVRSSTSGAGAGMAIYFPSLFFAGVWIPRTVMSDGLVTMSDLTPFGSAVQSLEDSWNGVTPSSFNLAVMAVWAIVVGFLAVRLFRWE